MRKIKTMLVLVILLTVTAAFGQSPVKAIIHLKDGKTINAYHFGKLNCESNRYSPTFTILRGKYNGNHTEVNDYKDISKLVLTGFTSPPVASVGNQKGSITVIKKSGESVPLEEAELVMSCFGPSDRYNEIHVQIVNPLSEKAVDMAIEMNKIESISF
jgi:hypothetical protein